ncbi:hypothetical protein R5W23_005572 [Gemmata sp. JC673]|uniref:Uncharacterized protein n=1 Tax=Gemmata algarum TaxID=2975278 RepID=A0ABU5ETG9_9BACT|nr:hypothetical protein [Gemmata algarum]MDY3558455.1 hypothetical protein [Gemmata algarum]
MRLSRSRLTNALRHMVAVAALLAQVIATTGAPVVVRPAKGGTGAIPFPCQSHPCGCQTSEQGWAGDCCCFTLEQKLAWAEERGITPPEHVRPAVAARQLARTSKQTCCTKNTKSCCESAPHADGEHESQASKPVVRWVAGMFAQKCRGEGPSGLLKLELISVPARPVEPRGAFALADSVREPVVHITPVSFRPPTRPPRIS